MKERRGLGGLVAAGDCTTQHRTSTVCRGNHSLHPDNVLEAKHLPRLAGTGVSKVVTGHRKLLRRGCRIINSANKFPSFQFHSVHSRSRTGAQVETLTTLSNTCTHTCSHTHAHSHCPCPHPPSQTSHPPIHAESSI